MSISCLFWWAIAGLMSSRLLALFYYGQVQDIVAWGGGSVGFICLRWRAVSFIFQVIERVSWRFMS